MEPAGGASLPEVVERLARVLTPEVLPLEIKDTHSYWVSAINAPVVDGEGDVVLVVSLMGFRADLSGIEIEHVGKLLRATASSVSAAIGGGGGDASR
jgi:hypothetical protein